MWGDIVPVIAVSTGIIVPLSVFYWLYHEGKGKREAVIEIAKHLDDPPKWKNCWGSLTSVKEPIDYRRGGVITLFVGVGIYLLGAVSFGSFFKASVYWWAPLASAL